MLKSVPVQEHAKADQAVCVCGSPGKPVLMLDGRRGYICSSCFTNEIRQYLTE
jgi:hypothetical protein